MEIIGKLKLLFLKKLYRIYKRFHINQHCFSQWYGTLATSESLSIRVIFFFILICLNVSGHIHGVSLSYLSLMWIIASIPFYTFKYENVAQICHIKSGGSHSVVVLALELDQSTHQLGNMYIECGWSISYVHMQPISWVDCPDSWARSSIWGGQLMHGLMLKTCAIWGCM